MQKLDHETGESLKSPGNPDCGVDLNEYSFGSVDKDLQLSCFIYR